MGAIRDKNTVEDKRTSKMKEADEAALRASESGFWKGFQSQVSATAEAAKTEHDKEANHGLDEA